MGDQDTPLPSRLYDGLNGGKRRSLQWIYKRKGKPPVVCVRVTPHGAKFRPAQIIYQTEFFVKY